MLLQGKDFDLLRHMLGANERPANRGYRNYFCASHSGDDYDGLCRLEAVGFVQRGSRNEHSQYFHATREGCVAVGLNENQIARAME